MQNWLRRWKATWHPERFHGWGREKNYFEGWYYKIVSPDEQFAFALIPGISRGKEGQAHAFIQEMDGKQYKVVYHEFSAEAFRPEENSFEVRLGDNFFSAEEVRLALPRLKGQLKMSSLHHWPKMLGAPGIMGWYSFVPFMECYHGVVSMHHELSGSLEVDGQMVDFSGGKGYLEKDWGKSFPSSWIWLQSNHFDHDSPVSVMASVANIPWLNGHFIGYIVGFLLDGHLYRFATYTGARMKARLGEEEVFISFKDAKHRLELTAHRKGGSGTLISPLSGEMVGKVNESLSSTVEVKLFRGESLLFEGTGRNTGLEVAGTVEALLTENWRR
jgi:hypothetical protein